MLGVIVNCFSGCMHHRGFWRYVGCALAEVDCLWAPGGALSKPVRAHQSVWHVYADLHIRFKRLYVGDSGVPAGVCAGTNVCLFTRARACEMSGRPGVLAGCLCRALDRACTLGIQGCVAVGDTRLA